MVKAEPKKDLPPKPVHVAHGSTFDTAIAAGTKSLRQAIEDLEPEQHTALEQAFKDALTGVPHDRPTEDIVRALLVNAEVNDRYWIREIGMDILRALVALHLIRAPGAPGKS